MAPVRLRAVGILILVTLVAAGCTSGTGATDEQAEPDEPIEEVVAPVSFCDEAADFINDRSVTDVSSFSQDFFAGVDSRLARLVDTAPSEIRRDLEALRLGFAETDEIFAQFDYDVTDERLGAALTEVNNESMLAATDSIQLHLQQSCDLEPIGSLDPDQVNDIIDSFGVDRALAECLNLELGDIANIDSEDLTPELMAKPVCGTSLFALLSGGGPTT